jgi:hypothetical protein
MPERNTNGASRGAPAAPDFDEVDDASADVAECGVNDDVLYLKYCLEGAASLSEVAGVLRSLAADLERRASAGWSLIAPVDNGYLHFCRRPDGERP